MQRVSSATLSGAVLALSLNVSGCIGLGVATLGEEKTPISNPGIGNERSQVWSRVSNDPALSTSVLLRQWGRPDRVAHNSNQSDEWIYWSTGVIWSGIDLWALLLPLPLAIPTGYVRVVFTVQDGQVVSAYRAWNKLEGKYFCGLLTSNIIFGGDALVCGSVKWVTSDG